jgi:alkylation response protein AidB-like acyl-CoA dehydrogenase
MLITPTEDQEFFRETTARFLAEKAPVGEVRRLHEESATGYEAAYWRQAAELGWTSLLVDEAHGGGSISGAGLVDLTLVAYEVGRHAGPGPLLVTNVVASALSAVGGDQHAEVLAGLLDGSTVATWAYTDKRPHDGLGDIALTITPDGDDLVLDGVKRPVEAGSSASHALVTGRTGDGLTQVLVPLDSPGVSVVAMTGVDMTRRFCEVRFDGVRVPAASLVGELGGAADQVEAQLLQAIVISSAETVGAMQAGFDITVEYAFDRYSFGRPLASYQALKHRYADDKTVVEASHAIADAAAAAVAAGAADAADLCSAAKDYTGDRGVDLLHDCVQLLGGIGVTYEHDIHLFLRRVSTNRALYGTPQEHRQRLAALLARKEVAA